MTARLVVPVTVAEKLSVPPTGTSGDTTALAGEIAMDTGFTVMGMGRETLLAAAGDAVSRWVPAVAGAE